MATRIKEKYLAEAVPALQQKFGYKNVMEIPKLEKIVINMGLGDCKDNAKAMEMAVNELTTIVALPRVRDFRGVSTKAFDGRGNYALGIREQLLFPEIEYDKVEKIRGMEMIFVTTAKTDEECMELLRLLGMPFAQA